jgi:hypothetical protein
MCRAHTWLVQRLRPGISMRRQALGKRACSSAQGSLRSLVQATDHVMASSRNTEKPGWHDLRPNNVAGTHGSPLGQEIGNQMAIVKSLI